MRRGRFRARSRARPSTTAPDGCVRSRRPCRVAPHSSAARSLGLECPRRPGETREHAEVPTTSGPLAELTRPDERAPARPNRLSRDSPEAGSPRRRDRRASGGRAVHGDAALSRMAEKSAVASLDDHRTIADRSQSRSGQWIVPYPPRANRPRRSRRPTANGDRCPLGFVPAGSGASPECGANRLVPPARDRRDSCFEARLVYGGQGDDRDPRSRTHEHSCVQSPTALSVRIEGMDPSAADAAKPRLPARQGRAPRLYLLAGLRTDAIRGEARPSRRSTSTRHRPVARYHDLEAAATVVVGRARRHLHRRRGGCGRSRCRRARRVRRADARLGQRLAVVATTPTPTRALPLARHVPLPTRSTCPRGPLEGSSSSRQACRARPRA
jgi:hypothetical protein